MGALCWVLLSTGDGGERILVRGTSRSGRQVKTWINALDLTNFRAGWTTGKGMGLEHNSTPMSFDSRDDAQHWAGGMNKHFGRQPVRKHAAEFAVLSNP
jgi:hypothetical protein